MAATRVVFVAESPHISEVEPDSLAARRPLCGAAGRAWWKMLREIFEGERDTVPDVSLAAMLRFCRQHRIAVINAVQYPLDPKVAARFPEADPVSNLGFAKVTGEWNYKRQKKSDALQGALRNLQARLSEPHLKDARIWSLGNDSEWFVTQAIGGTPEESRFAGKLPHPSAWWRQGGLFERTAREKLTAIRSEFFASRKSA